MYKNVASQKIAVFAFDYSTGAPKTGDSANLTLYVNKDFASVVALTDTSATELSSTNAPGWYIFDVAQAETNADVLHFTGKSSTGSVTVVGQLIWTKPPNLSLLSVDSNGRIDIIKVAGTTQTARDIGTSVLLSSGTGTGQISLSSGTVTTGALSSGTITAASIASAALSAAKFAADTGLVPFLSGTAQSGGSNTITLASATSVPNSLIIGAVVSINGGTGAGQSRNITAWVSSTDTATVDVGWTTNPDNTSTYYVSYAAPISVPTAAEIQVAVAAGAVASVTGNVGGNVTGTVGSVVGAVGSVTGAVGSVTGAVGSVTGNVGGNVTGSIGSLATQAKTDVNAEVVDVLRTDTIPDSIAADGSLGTLTQAIYMILQMLTESSVSATTLTVKKVNGSTSLFTCTLDDGTNPTSITRAS